ncbi:hypothetical protein HMPREF9080_02427 [Cardiobacterium valvarum F0432]|uniref:Uncharacterized protein n=1 Tax=Cardiobacterium valvarum F0432 TaxID=797473 RepID=G9ZI18_9GAMM|nr:hypothetical protein HMPREF9080_02427 [Cardiobacterium valvarum F0432]
MPSKISNHQKGPFLPTRVATKPSNHAAWQTQQPRRLADPFYCRATS